MIIESAIRNFLEENGFTTEKHYLLNGLAIRVLSEVGTDIKLLDFKKSVSPVEFILSMAYLQYERSLEEDKLLSKKLSNNSCLLFLAPLAESDAYNLIYKDDKHTLVFDFHINDFDSLKLLKNIVMNISSFANNPDVSSVLNLKPYTEIVNGCSFFIGDFYDKNTDFLRRKIVRVSEDSIFF